MPDPALVVIVLLVSMLLALGDHLPLTGSLLLFGALLLAIFMRER